MDERRWSVLFKLEDEKKITMKEGEILMGKLNYYSALVPKGARNIAFMNYIVAKKAGFYDNRKVMLEVETLKQVK
jgi:hypothetical protein